MRELRTDPGPVLLITALHRDFASTDTLAALAIADIGVALDDPRAATPWTADIITGTDLAAAVRILSAIPVARASSVSSVHLAQGGTTLAGLLLVTGEQARTTNPASFRRWLNPVNTAAATALLSGSWSAATVLRLPDPTPQPLTAWHALDPEIVYARLAGGAHPMAVDPGTPTWRRLLDDLSYEPLVSRCVARHTRWPSWRRRRGMSSPTRWLRSWRWAPRPRRSSAATWTRCWWPA
ncbi:putative cation-transporting ATPase I domain protein [Mycobacterium ulcerans str. Harvey]|uniref:Cation-transporting ATPase I domain protein n=1 Tax=Mycobacterium ulcerans str. Harvey TaxID=1299332 RepID=A0ABN0QM24_MYCUL|nr:putative cation-transporting ATPase I domain protein [Mycobacterium ulcerans str. Harvey]